MFLDDMPTYRQFAQVSRLAARVREGLRSQARRTLKSS